ncbi:hypothetical protein DL96DRAFT_1810541, partial [Flagelloscypha sp. PMI_526]
MLMQEEVGKLREKQFAKKKPRKGYHQANGRARMLTPQEWQLGNEAKLAAEKQAAQDKADKAAKKAEQKAEKNRKSDAEKKRKKDERARVAEERRVQATERRGRARGRGQGHRRGRAQKHGKGKSPEMQDKGKRRAQESDWESNSEEEEAETSSESEPQSSDQEDMDNRLALSRRNSPDKSTALRKPYPKPRPRGLAARQLSTIDTESQFAGPSHTEDHSDLQFEHRGEVEVGVEVNDDEGKSSGDDDALEVRVLLVISHKWWGRWKKDLKFFVRWEDGDEGWIPLAEANDLEVLQFYLDEQGFS